MVAGQAAEAPPARLTVEPPEGRRPPVVKTNHLRPIVHVHHVQYRNTPCPRQRCIPYYGLARPFPTVFPKAGTGVVGLAACILAVLFLCQRFGTAGVAALFSPVAVSWCLALAAIGVYNLVVVPPSVALSALSAVSPHHAVQFFARNGAQGWVSLGSLALCITGAEALFADLGHFNRKSITLATTVLVYPALILT